MLFKVLMFRWFAEKFHFEGNKYVTKLVHLHCRCKDYPLRQKHKLFVLFCSMKPFGFWSRSSDDLLCTCASELAGDVCKQWGTVSYILNFGVYKLCLEQLPESIKDKVILIEQYFERIKCEPFFFLMKKVTVPNCHYAIHMNLKLTLKLENFDFFLADKYCNDE